MIEEQELLRYFRKLDRLCREHLVQKAAFMVELTAKGKKSPRFSLIAGTAIQEPVNRRAKAKARPKKFALKIVACGGRGD